MFPGVSDPGIATSFGEKRLDTAVQNCNRANNPNAVKNVPALILSDALNNPAGRCFLLIIYNATAATGVIMDETTIRYALISRMNGQKNHYDN